MRLTDYSPTEFPVDLLFNLLDSMLLMNASMLLMNAGGFHLFKSPVKIQILNGVFNLVYSDVSILHKLSSFLIRHAESKIKLLSERVLVLKKRLHSVSTTEVFVSKQTK